MALTVNGYFSQVLLAGDCKAILKYSDQKVDREPHQTSRSNHQFTGNGEDRKNAKHYGGAVSKIRIVGNPID
jgi:hypothetical protein